MAVDAVQVRFTGSKEGLPVTSVRELAILQQSQHPNIVSLLKVVTGTRPDRYCGLGWCSTFAFTCDYGYGFCCTAHWYLPTATGPAQCLLRVVLCASPCVPCSTIHMSLEYTAA
jgi:hypothetical protein